MTYYKNNSGHSGIESYEIGQAYIIIKFYNNNKLYKYSYQKAGRIHVDTMKKLAVSGMGLNTYINEHVSKLYD